MYLATVAGFGLLALFVSVPLGVAGRPRLRRLHRALLNFDIGGVQSSAEVLALEVAAGLRRAAAGRALAGSRRHPHHRARGDQRLWFGQGPLGTGRIDRLIERVRGVSRPMLLSLRNTFRRKGPPGADARDADARRCDLCRYPQRPELARWARSTGCSSTGTTTYSSSSADRIASSSCWREALRMPGVVKAESWGFRSARRVRRRH